MKRMLFCVLVALPLAAQNTMVRTSGIDCSAGQHVYGYNPGAGALKCSADSGGSITALTVPIKFTWGMPSYTSTAWAGAANFGHFDRFVVETPISFSKIMITLKTQSPSTCNGGAGPCGTQVKIYADGATVGAVLVASQVGTPGGTPDTSTAAPKAYAGLTGSAVTAGVATLNRGVYWVGFGAEDASTTIDGYGVADGPSQAAYATCITATKAAMGSGTGTGFTLTDIPGLSLGIDCNAHNAMVIGFAN